MRRGRGAASCLVCVASTAAQCLRAGSAWLIRPSPRAGIASFLLGRHDLLALCERMWIVRGQRPFGRLGRRCLGIRTTTLVLAAGVMMLRCSCLLDLDEVVAPLTSRTASRDFVPTMRLDMPGRCRYKATPLCVDWRERKTTTLTMTMKPPMSRPCCRCLRPLYSSLRP